MMRISCTTYFPRSHSTAPLPPHSRLRPLRLHRVKTDPPAVAQPGGPSDSSWAPWSAHRVRTPFLSRRRTLFCSRDKSPPRPWPCRGGFLLGTQACRLPPPRDNRQSQGRAHSGPRLAHHPSTRPGNAPPWPAHRTRTVPGLARSGVERLVALLLDVGKSGPLKEPKRVLEGVQEATPRMALPW